MKQEKAWFDSDALLAEAMRHLGRRPSRRWLEEQVRLGLLDRRTARGRPGRRGGRQSGGWPPTQMALFRRQLAARAQGASTPELCALVIAEWVDRGPKAVPTRQARRVLLTYLKHKRMPWRQLYEFGRQLAVVFAGEAGALEAALQDRRLSDHGLSRTAVARYAEAVADAFRGEIDPEALGAGKESAGALPLLPEGVVSLKVDRVSICGDEVPVLPLWSDWPESERALGPEALVMVCSRWQLAPMALDECDDRWLEDARICLRAALALWPSIVAQLRLQPELENVLAAPPGSREGAAEMADMALLWLGFSLHLSKTNDFSLTKAAEKLQSLAPEEALHGSSAAAQAL